MFNVFPSTTSPMLGLGATEAGKDDDRLMPKNFLFVLSTLEFFLTSSNVKSKRDSQVSWGKMKSL